MIDGIDAAQGKSKVESHRSGNLPAVPTALVYFSNVFLRQLLQGLTYLLTYLLALLTSKTAATLFVLLEYVCEFVQTNLAISTRVNFPHNDIYVRL